MTERISDIILTAGPTISEREYHYVTDAVLNGWNHHHSDYIRSFEQRFADYVGTKYAMATSSCTGALHLALMAMGIGPGDEVIVPETTWIASASAVCYCGATPVFCDILPDSWVMDPTKVESLISENTKAIMPVHLYGHPVEMETLWQLAKKHDLKIIEDAAPSIGARYKDRRTGSLGDVAGFSFQGAKALVTGEGGILVTSDEEIYQRARFLNDHGRDPQRPLESKEIGYKYKMSNLQAALGLAQVERADEIVEQKRQIQSWYRERLSGLEQVTLNAERPDCFNIFWMSCIVLQESVKESRDDFMQLLKERGVDSRPFFSPISSFPMFRDSFKGDNPVAYSVPLRGINLPSGHERTEEEIDYICAQIRDLLGEQIAPAKGLQAQGWLSRRERLRHHMAQIKQDSSFRISLDRQGAECGWLNTLTASLAKDASVIKELERWNENPTDSIGALDENIADLEGNWIENRDSALFVIRNEQDQRIGHIGLRCLDYRNNRFEICNTLLGQSDQFSDALELAVSALVQWSFMELEISELYLEVVSDNDRGLKLAQSLKFREVQRCPLREMKTNSGTRWIRHAGEPYEEIRRYSITMKITRRELGA